MMKKNREISDGEAGLRWYIFVMFLILIYMLEVTFFP